MPKQKKMSLTKDQREVLSFWWLQWQQAVKAHEAARWSWQRRALRHTVEHTHLVLNHVLAAIAGTGAQLSMTTDGPVVIRP